MNEFDNVDSKSSPIRAKKNSSEEQKMQNLINAIKKSNDNNTTDESSHNKFPLSNLDLFNNLCFSSSDSISNTGWYLFNV